jgi:hypothetical protein
VLDGVVDYLPAPTDIPPVCKCPECKTEIEWEGDDE